MSEPQKIQIPLNPAMLQGLLGGAQPAQKTPEVVEVMLGLGGRLAFNLDAIESVYEQTGDKGCVFKLKGDPQTFATTLSYDDFLEAINVKPRVLGQEAAGD